MKPGAAGIELGREKLKLKKTSNRYNISKYLNTEFELASRFSTRFWLL